MSIKVTKPDVEWRKQLTPDQYHGGLDPRQREGYGSGGGGICIPRRCSERWWWR